MIEVLKRLNEIERMLANVILVGDIIEADYANALVKAKSGKIETGWVPWITTRAGNDADWWAPEVGEQVVILSPNGNPELAVVLPAIYQNQYPAPDNKPTVRRVLFADGADFSYDREVKALKIILSEGATTDLVSKGGVSIVGNVHVTGNITATEEITDHTRSMQADRDIYNDHDHPHGDPVTGKVNQKQ